MTPPFVNNGRYIFVDAADSWEEQHLEAGYIVPPQTGLTASGAPIVEQSHEYVIRNPGPDAED